MTGVTEGPSGVPGLGLMSDGGESGERTRGERASQALQAEGTAGARQEVGDSPV